MSQLPEKVQAKLVKAAEMKVGVDLRAHEEAYKKLREENERILEDGARQIKQLLSRQERAHTKILAHGTAWYQNGTVGEAKYQT